MTFFNVMGKSRAKKEKKYVGSWNAEMLDEHVLGKREEGLCNGKMGRKKGFSYGAWG